MTIFEATKNALVNGRAIRRRHHSWDGYELVIHEDIYVMRCVDRESGYSCPWVPRREDLTATDWTLA